MLFNNKSNVTYSVQNWLQEYVLFVGFSIFERKGLSNKTSVKTRPLAQQVQPFCVPALTRRLEIEPFTTGHPTEADLERGLGREYGSLKTIGKYWKTVKSLIPLSIFLLFPQCCLYPNRRRKVASTKRLHQWFYYNYFMYFNSKKLILSWSSQPARRTWLRSNSNTRPVSVLCIRKQILLRNGLLDRSLTCTLRYCNLSVLLGTKAEYFDL